MSAILRKPMTQSEFFPWAEAQNERYEFDGSRPVAMTGGNLGHSRMIRNLNRQLANRLSGSACESLGPDAGVATVGDTVRYPDAVVTCSPLNPRDLLVPNPIVVAEIISPTSGRLDRVIKLREYQAVPTIRHYIIVELTTIALTVLSRAQANDPFTATGLTEPDTLDLPEIGIQVPVAALYEGITPDTADAPP